LLLKIIEDKMRGPVGERCGRQRRSEDDKLKYY